MGCAESKHVRQPRRPKAEQPVEVKDCGGVPPFTPEAELAQAYFGNLEVLRRTAIEEGIMYPMPPDGVGRIATIAADAAATATPAQGSKGKGGSGGATMTASTNGATNQSNGATASGTAGKRGGGGVNPSPSGSPRSNSPSNQSRRRFLLHSSSANRNGGGSPVHSPTSTSGPRQVQSPARTFTVYQCQPLLSETPIGKGMHSRIFLANMVVTSGTIDEVKPSVARITGNSSSTSAAAAIGKQSKLAPSPSSPDRRFLIAMKELTILSSHPARVLTDVTEEVRSWTRLSAYCPRLLRCIQVEKVFPDSHTEPILDASIRQASTSSPSSSGPSGNLNTTKRGPGLLSATLSGTLRKNPSGKFGAAPGGGANGGGDGVNNTSFSAGSPRRGSATNDSANRVRIYTEFCKYGTLRTFQLREMPEAFQHNYLHELTARAFMREVLMALLFLHEQGTLQYDLCGRNIFISHPIRSVYRTLFPAYIADAPIGDYSKVPPARLKHVLALMDPPAPNRGVPSTVKTELTPGDESPGEPSPVRGRGTAETGTSNLRMGGGNGGRRGGRPHNFSTAALAPDVSRGWNPSGIPSLQAREISMGMNSAQMLSAMNADSPSGKDSPGQVNESAAGVRASQPDSELSNGRYYEPPDLSSTVVLTHELTSAMSKAGFLSDEHDERRWQNVALHKYMTDHGYEDTDSLPAPSPHDGFQGQDEADAVMSHCSAADKATMTQQLGHIQVLPLENSELGGIAVVCPNRFVNPTAVSTAATGVVRSSASTTNTSTSAGVTATQGNRSASPVNGKGGGAAAAAAGGAEEDVLRSPLTFTSGMGFDGHKLKLDNPPPQLIPASTDLTIFAVLGQEGGSVIHPVNTSHAATTNNSNTGAASMTSNTKNGSPPGSGLRGVSAGGGGGMGKEESGLFVDTPEGANVPARATRRKPLVKLNCVTPIRRAMSQTATVSVHDVPVHQYITVTHAAPEVLQHRQFSPASDVYAFAMTFIELVTPGGEILPEVLPTDLPFTKPRTRREKEEYDIKLVANMKKWYNTRLDALIKYEDDVAKEQKLPDSVESHPPVVVPVPDHLSDECKSMLRWCLQRDPEQRPTPAQLLRSKYFLFGDWISGAMTPSDVKLPEAPWGGPVDYVLAGQAAGLPAFTEANYCDRTAPRTQSGPLGGTSDVKKKK